MLKDKLSKISTRIFYVVFAVVISVTVWVYVEMTENEIQIADVSNIGITFRNEDILRDRGFLVTPGYTETLSITFQASRSDMARLQTPGAVTAEVDLSSITSTGYTELTYIIIFPANVSPGDVSIIGRSTERITFLVDIVLERRIDVEVDYTGGTASEDLIQEPEVYDPMSITVRGPERIVSRIRYARVPIYRENLAGTLTEDLGFVLIDENGDELDDELRSLLDISHETIRVTVPISEMKSVPLDIHYLHGRSTTDENITVEINPRTVSVSGEPLAIADINSISLGTIDMTSFELSYSNIFRIIIPDHLRNLSGETEALVTVTIIGLEIAFRPTNNLQVITPTGYRVEMITQSIVVRLRGAPDDLMHVEPLNLRVVADASALGPGSHRIRATAYIDGIDANLDPVGEYWLAFTIIAE